MSELRKANTDHPYFLTLTAVGWIDIFTRQCYSDVIVRSLQYCMKFKSLEVYAFVIMPSHVHLIARSNESRLSAILRDFKSFTAKEILTLVKTESTESRRDWLLHVFQYHANFQRQNADHMFWQKTNHAVELSNADSFDRTMEYVHNNPVAAGYVLQPDMWHYSSACLYCPLKTSVA